MSAIWGQVFFTKEDESVLKGSAELMRSPYHTCRIDRFEETNTKQAFFGAGIQYFTAEAHGEQLPILTGDVLLTADVTLDNRKELCEKLGIMDDAVPDGSLVSEMYRGYADKAFELLRGVFAVAVWEEALGRLTLAVDATGSRCLYYMRTKDGVIFSTLIEPILRVYPDTERNMDYLKDFMAAPGLMPNLSATETPWKNVYKIEAGTILTFTKEGTEKREYMSPAIYPAEKHMGAAAYGKAFRKLYGECVADVLRSGGKTAIALSSGLDSASVGAQAADELRKQNENLYAYTYVPAKEMQSDKRRHLVYDERGPVMDLVRMHPNIIPHFCDNENQSCVEFLEEELEFMEIPFKAYANLPSLCEIYEKAYREGCRIMLNGQYGNTSVSCGYIDDVLYELYDRGDKIRFFTWLMRYAKKVGEGRRSALKACRNYFEYARKVYEEAGKLTDSLPDIEIENPFAAKLAEDGYLPGKRFFESGIRVMDKVPTGRRAYREGVCRKAVYSYIGEMETKMSLKFGILLRDPTRDIRMLGFCYRMPFEYFAYKGTPRWLIRGNLSDLLPESITGDWLKYSVQNGDCYERIMRDFPRMADKIRTVIEENGANETVEKLVNIAEMCDFLRNYEKELTADNERASMDFFFAYILLLHIAGSAS